LARPLRRQCHVYPQSTKSNWPREPGARGFTPQPTATAPFDESRQQPACRQPLQSRRGRRIRDIFNTAIRRRSSNVYNPLPLLNGQHVAVSSCGLQMDRHKQQSRRIGARVTIHSGYPPRASPTPPRPTLRRHSTSAKFAAALALSPKTNLRSISAWVPPRMLRRNPLAQRRPPKPPAHVPADAHLHRPSNASGHPDTSRYHRPVPPSRSLGTPWPSRQHWISPTLPASSMRHVARGRGAARGAQPQSFRPLNPRFPHDFLIIRVL